MPGKTPPASAKLLQHDSASMRPQRNAGENHLPHLFCPLAENGFNEAPAKCRGKRRICNLGERGWKASMRPQRNAGENSVEIGIEDIVLPASMRPQRNAGENSAILDLLRPTERASMRPQRNAGENVLPPGKAPSSTRASMRPQRNAGENIGHHGLLSVDTGCFNEAPAKCRGKPHQRRTQLLPYPHASMRPQRNAGENTSSPAMSGCRAAGFNEAPAKCRGKRCTPGRWHYP